MINCITQTIICTAKIIKFLEIYIFDGKTKIEISKNIEIFAE